MTIRRLLNITTVLLATLAIATSLSLVVLTTRLHEVGGVLRTTARVARLAREAEVDLLVYERAADPIARSRVAARLRSKGGWSEVHVPPRTEEVRLTAQARIEAYLRASRESNDAASARELDDARAALGELVDANIEDADLAQAAAARLDVLGDVIGLSVALCVVGGLALLMLWSRRDVVRPMLRLTDAMARFGAGDLTARATPQGAAELQQMARQFNTMSDALAQRHEARMTYLAGVAHDLRNPLSALQMSTALVDPEKLPEGSGVRRAFVVVRRQVGRLVRMVDDLLEATRIESGHLALAIEERDLREIVRDVAELFGQGSPIHDLQVSLPSEPLLVQCDALRVEQTLTNLISNAIKYSPRGGPVRVVARRRRETATVSVTDTGMGIAEADLEHIWEPFRRTGVSSETIPGVGLGLWTARRIAEAHGGSIDVLSTLGTGSTFTLALPSSAATRAARADGPHDGSTARNDVQHG